MYLRLSEIEETAVVVAPPELSLSPLAVTQNLSSGH